MMGHRLFATSLMNTGDFVEARAHSDRALALYDPEAHRSLTTRFGQDVRVAILSYRPWVMWMLGYPAAAFTDVERSLSDARETGHAATLMVALSFATTTYILLGDYATAGAVIDEVITLADEKGALLWKAFAITNRGCVSRLNGKPSVDIIASGIAALRATGATVRLPLYLPDLAKAHADLGQFDDAWRCIGEAMTAVEITKETVFEADVHRIAGEIALLSPQPDTAKAEACFERALAVARAQQAKSWELRAAISMARLWCDQGKRDQARDLLAPIYDWFTEGFDTRDLKQAKLLLDELA